MWNTLCSSPLLRSLHSRKHIKIMFNNYELQSTVQHLLLISLIFSRLVSSVKVHFSLAILPCSDPFPMHASAFTQPRSRSVHSYWNRSMHHSIHWNCPAASSLNSLINLVNICRGARIRIRDKQEQGAGYRAAAAAAHASLPLSRFVMHT